MFWKNQRKTAHERRVTRRLTDGDAQRAHGSSKHRRRSVSRRAPGGGDLVEFNLTARRPWQVRAENRARNKRARASRRVNRQHR